MTKPSLESDPVLVVKVYSARDQMEGYFLSNHDSLVTIGIKKEGRGDWIAIPMEMIESLIKELYKIKIKKGKKK